MVSDATWTKWAKEVANNMANHHFETIRYHELFDKSFDGSTGFDLAEKADEHLYKKAEQLLKWGRKI